MRSRCAMIAAKPVPLKQARHGESVLRACSLCVKAMPKNLFPATVLIRRIAVLNSQIKIPPVNSVRREYGKRISGQIHNDTVLLRDNFCRQFSADRCSKLLQISCVCCFISCFCFIAIPCRSNILLDFFTKEFAVDNVFS